MIFMPASGRYSFLFLAVFVLVFLSSCFGGSDDGQYDVTDLFRNKSNIYEEVCALEAALLEGEKDDITEKMKAAEASFADAPEQYQERMRRFAFISMLSYDVYIKKLLIEKLIDGFDKKDKAFPEKKEKTRRRKKEQ